MSFSKDFKEFAIKGNVIDLAVAVVIGGAFTQIVNAIVAGILMPIVGLVSTNGGWQTWTIDAGKLHIQIGSVLGATVNFFAVAFVLFIIVKKLIAARPAEPPK